MRVTKLIKDYITKTVNDAIPIYHLCPEYEEAYEICDKARQEMERKIDKYSKELVKQFKEEYALPTDWKMVVRKGMSHIEFSTWNTPLSRESSRRTEEAKTRREEIINSVLLDMELGEINKQNLADAIAKALAE